MNASTTRAQQPASRRQFWLLVALFFGPLAVAFLLYYGLDGWKPGGSTAQGDLIEPPRPLPQVELESVAGAPAPTAELFRGHWSLVYIGAGACDAPCRDALTEMRQVRLALGDEMSRVERVYLYTDRHACCDLDYFESEHGGLMLAGLAGADGERVLAEFPAYDGVAAADSGRIYIVDPLGNLMMSYAANAPASGILKDLKKLLKLSHIG